MSTEEKGLVKIHTDSGELTLSPSIVRKYLVSGNGAVSDGEVAMFLALCKFQKLNPFLREAYLIKYGTQPASIITGKEVFLKRAMRAKDCRGFKAGIIYSTDQQGSIDYTDGVLPPGTKLAGGWAEVHRDGWAFPLRVEVSLQEYIAKKNDGTPNRMWAEKPATMIRKIALVQALREAFPEDLAGMYSPEELESGGDLPHTPIPIADYIDLSSQAKAHTGPEKATTHSPPPRIEEARRRSRRNKWQVDKAVFGDEQLQTCGSTPDQLLALREILRGQDTVSAGRIKKYLAEIGYSELSYLTSEEADSLMNNAQAKWFDSMPPIEPEATANGSDAVQCPLSHDTKVYRSFCNSECETRKMDGWCVALGEAPPEDEELI